jgi:hypothetical protein
LILRHLGKPEFCRARIFTPEANLCNTSAGTPASLRPLPLWAPLRSRSCFYRRLTKSRTNFPAVVLWRFRIVALGMQAILWSTLGLLFGAVAEQVLSKQDNFVRAIFGR